MITMRVRVRVIMMVRGSVLGLELWLGWSKVMVEHGTLIMVVAHSRISSVAVNGRPGKVG